jgi:hypothetical protein
MLLFVLVVRLHNLSPCAAAAAVLILCSDELDLSCHVFFRAVESI